MSKPTGKLIRLTANDVGAYTKAESDNKIADAKKAGTDAQTTANTANTNATNANNNANGRVPNTRKVNNKALSADITITAGDVGAYTKAESDTKIADAKKPEQMRKPRQMRLALMLPMQIIMQMEECQIRVKLIISH